GGGPREDRPRAPACDRRALRRGPGRPLDAGSRSRRGARHDRGRLRAVSPSAWLRPAHAAGTDRDEARARPRRRPAGPGRKPFLVSELWVPGMAGPLDDFVTRLHLQIDQFGATAETRVEVELREGAHAAVQAISAEPGYGFVT